MDDIYLDYAGANTSITNVFTYMFLPLQVNESIYAKIEKLRKLKKERIEKLCLARFGISHSDVNEFDTANIELKNEIALAEAYIELSSGENSDNDKQEFYKEQMEDEIKKSLSLRTRLNGIKKAKDIIDNLFQDYLIRTYRSECVQEYIAITGRIAVIKDSIKEKFEKTVNDTTDSKNPLSYKIVADSLNYIEKYAKEISRLTNETVALMCIYGSSITCANEHEKLFCRTILDNEELTNDIENQILISGRRRIKWKHMMRGISSITFNDDVTVHMV